MSRFNVIMVCVFVVFAAIAEAGSRVRRSPQFGQTSASGRALGGNRFPQGPSGIGGAGFGQPAVPRPGPSGFPAIPRPGPSGFPSGSRIRRSPQFGKASASATASSGNRFPQGPSGIGGTGFGQPAVPRPGPTGFQGVPKPGPSGFPDGNFGGAGNLARPSVGGSGFGQSSPGGLTVNIAKSVSISSGRGGSSSASAQSRT